MRALPPAIFLMGPTASGKTDLAMSLCKALPCELISVDSAMVYRGMDIGTAKPPPEELARFPHRLVDILDPLERYSAARFREDALRAMGEITAQGRIPLLVGGTMLYFKALLEGLAEMPPADTAVRAGLEAMARAEGLQALHRRLALIDPESAQRINPNDPQRLIRALEVFEISGMTMSEHRARQRAGETDEPAASKLPYTVARLSIAPAQRSLLHARIEHRFQQMVEQGLIDEVERLRSRSELHPELPSMRSVGYRQVWDYLDGLMSKQEMLARGTIATRQLAKRQFTWLRSWTNVHWLDSLARDNLSQALKYLRSLSILS